MAPVQAALALLKGVPPSSQWPVKFCVYNSLVAWVLGALTGNLSQVDRVWTFLPTIYTAYYALLPLWPAASPLPLFPYVPETAHPDLIRRYSPRALLMFALVFTWMCRLSYNTWRRGLFNLADEDYRWVVLKKTMHPLLLHIFNFVFIAFIQNIILFLLAVPVQIAALQQPAHLSASDYVLAALALTALATEFVADNQQYAFQTFKHSGVLDKNQWPGARIRWAAADAKRGFITRGLWAWSRHPNFLCEQSFWVIINLFPLVAPEHPQLPPLSAASITPFWPLAPSIVICALFFSSTIFTESISASKYPDAYRAYKQRVAMFVPVLTPVWALLLQVRGKKAAVDGVVYGQDVPDKKNE